MTDTPTLTVAAWPIIGHDLSVARLAQAAVESRPAHAYLFSGPAHIGKETVARTFVRGVGAQQPPTQ